MNVNFDDFHCFALVVEHGGFSAAERATKMPKSKLSRRILNLEDRLGIRLIHRNSHQFSVTEMGWKIFEQAKIMQHAVQTAQDIIQESSQTPRGIVRVSLPTAMIKDEFSKILPEFLTQYPDIQIHLIVSNRRVDLINEGVDLALRVRSHLDNDQGLIIRNFYQIREFLYASPHYLQQYGTPQNPQDLTHHRMLCMTEQQAGFELALHSEQNQSIKVKINPTISALDFPLLKTLTEHHQGICLMPETFTRDEVKNGTLIPILPQWTAPSGIFHMVYPSRKGLLPAVKVLIDFLLVKWAV